MFAEIITIGDELLIGQVVDTNSAWMGRELNRIGIEVVRVTSVRDRKEEILDAVDSALRRVGLVLMTGGLGPTKDDITKQTLCEYFGTRLVFSEEVFRNIQQVLAGRIPMNELNRSQAYVPENAVILPNRVGSAPVTWFEKDGSVLVSMPGVPQEMTTVMTEEVIPRLCEKFRTDFILHRSFMVKNYPESVLAEKLQAWEEGLPHCIKLAYLPKPGWMRLRLTARGRRKPELNQLLDEEGQKLKVILGEDLYADREQAPEVLLGEILTEKGWTVATAESCTGGNIAARIASVAGSSAYFKGSIVAYANQVKEDLLGVLPETLEKYGAVSRQTVIEMVKGAMNTLKTDCALATSGIAGPAGGTPDKPVGTVWIAVACKNEIFTFLQQGDRGREMNIERACNKALIMLSDALE
ncbi:MAG: CinA family nicotinamide mononucleotide deamidase-related protein [Bacteroides sp.]|nr:CinA family nicotinamide mononucleotide deamidase-related protein [Bacteroides sp.]